MDSPLCGLLLLGMLACPLAAEQSGPNILWISTEDISAHIGCYGDPHAITPHIDRLARQGVRYTNAYVVAGVCAPCRSSIITGLYPTSLGTHHMRCQAQLPPEIRCFPEYLRRAGYYCTNNSKTDYQFKRPAGSWDESSGKAHWRKRPAKDQPFFCVFNFTTTHESRIASNDRYQSATSMLSTRQFTDAGKLETLPPYYPDTPVTRKDWARNYDLIAAMDEQVGEILGQLEEDGLADSTIVFFWSDHGIGLPRAKRWLYDSGMHVPLIVRIPEQYRQKEQGRPGSVNDELVSLIDLAPTMLNLAGQPLPAYFQGRAFLGASLGEPRQYVYGARDRMDERYDIIRAVRDKQFKYLRNYEPFKPYYQYMNTPEKGATMQELRRQHADGKLPPAARLFMANSKPNEELYDTAADPHELNNLAANPNYRQILIRMRRAHMDWVAETRDVGLIPEPEIIVREQALGSRFAILRQEGAKSLVEELRRVANLGLAGVDGLDDLKRALGSPDAAVRYWALVGLGNLGQKAAASANAVTRYLDDPSASVRIAAARALARMDQPGPALEVLQEELASSEEWVRLNAAIVLDEMDEQARPAIMALKKAATDRQNKYVVRVANRALNELLGTHNMVP
jgi:uncharacterized sulfatase